MFRRWVSPVGAASPVQLRQNFYRPIRNAGPHKWERRLGRLQSGLPFMDRYRRLKMDPKPIPEKEKNTYFGKETLWNPIPSAAGVWAKKSADWGWPQRDPPPRGLRQSPEYFPHFFQKYFPDVQCRLQIDSVLNNETRTPVFSFPCDMSKQEIRNYLRNIYGIDNIEKVETRNSNGQRYKNELGMIRMTLPFKRATVTLDAPVVIELKTVKETSDARE